MALTEIGKPYDTILRGLIRILYSCFRLFIMINTSRCNLPREGIVLLIALYADDVVVFTESFIFRKTASAG